MPPTKIQVLHESVWAHSQQMLTRTEWMSVSSVVISWDTNEGAEEKH